MLKIVTEVLLRSDLITEGGCIIIKLRFLAIYHSTYDNIKLMKKLTGILLCVSMILGLAACGKKETKEIEVATLGKSLLEEIIYEDTLEEIDLDTASIIYDFQDAKIINSSIYVGSGGTAEEIAVIQCEDSENVGKVKDAFKERIEEQTESFRDYVPTELDKLEKALIIEKGTYIILSISNDDKKAKELIEQAF